MEIAAGTVYGHKTALGERPSRVAATTVVPGLDIPVV
jgi:hypothetical protein